MISTEHLEKSVNEYIEFFLYLEISPLLPGMLGRQGQTKTGCVYGREHMCICVGKAGGGQGRILTPRNIFYMLSSVRCGSHGAALSLSPSWWKPLNLISTQDGKIFCRRTACDCQNPSADLFCCPECDTRVTSQCLDQNGHKLYRSGDNWTHSCQQCRCLVRQLPLEGGGLFLWRGCTLSCPWTLVPCAL